MICKEQKMHQYPIIIFIKYFQPFSALPEYRNLNGQLYMFCYDRGIINVRTMNKLLCTKNFIHTFYDIFTRSHALQHCIIDCLEYINP